VFAITLQGIVPARGLKADELWQIRELAALCDKTDGIRLKLNWYFLESRPEEEKNDWLYYENGELVGFLAMYAFSPAEAEFSGMVHPDYRRQGIFSRLVLEAKAECARRGIPRLLFMNQKGSGSGKMFLEHLGAKYVVTEFWMDYDRSKTLAAKQTSTSSGTSFRLRKAVREQDVETLVRIDALGFDMPEESARTLVANAWDNPEKMTLIAEVDSEPSGKINVQIHDEMAFIYGFCMLPQVRGRGYGRKTLEETIRTIEALEPGIAMSLEVAAQNEGALSLYESCGFRIDNANDYYEIKR